MFSKICLLIIVFLGLNPQQGHTETLNQYLKLNYQRACTDILNYPPTANKIYKSQRQQDILPIQDKQALTAQKNKIKVTPQLQGTYNMFGQQTHTLQATFTSY